MKKNVVSAGGIIIREIDKRKHILLVVKPDKMLTFPKGHVERGESLEQAAMREVQEETGLTDIQIGQKLGVVVRPSIENTGEKVTKEIHLFAMTSHSYAHDQAEEQYDWFPFEEALEKLRFDEEKDFLRNLIAQYKI